MRVTNCEHPRLVFNKYLGRKVLASCGKCAVCRSERRNRWISRIINEAKAWKFVLVLHLDYNDDMVPNYQLENDQLVEQQKRFFSSTKFDISKNYVPVSDFEEFLNDKPDYESDYFFGRLYDHTGGIMHCDIRDIQRFCKRLNTYCKREVTGKYHNFRYCIAAEYGETTFRPHYHGILFFSDYRIAKEIDRLVIKAWSDANLRPLGHAFVERDRGHAASYISKYITKPAYIPLCYSHSSIKTFFTSSRRPPLGVFDEPVETLQELFRSGSCTRVATKSTEGVTRPAPLPVSGAFESHLFPKCPLYCSVPAWLRTRFIKYAIDSASLPDFIYRILRQFYNCNALIDLTDRDWFDSIPLFDKRLNIKSDIAVIIDRMTEGMSRLHFLYQFYYCARNIDYLSNIFAMSVDDCILCIDRHYQKKELYTLGLFYRMQSDLIDKRLVDDIAVFYPYNHMDVSQVLRYPPKSVNDCKASKLIIKDMLWQEELCKQLHLKSGYLDSLKEKDNILFNFIKDYYGKKCDEDAKAITLAWS